MSISTVIGAVKIQCTPSARSWRSCGLLSGVFIAGLLRVPGGAGLPASASWPTGMTDQPPNTRYEEGARRRWGARARTAADGPHEFGGRRTGYQSVEGGLGPSIYGKSRGQGPRSEARNLTNRQHTSWQIVNSPTDLAVRIDTSAGCVPGDKVVWSL